MNKQKAEWMSGKYGIAVHFLSSIPTKDGKLMDFNEMANGFDAEGFAEELKDMGAEWLLFTIGQNTGKYWSENPYLEAKVPGCCSDRDLVKDIISAVKKRGMRFIAYFPTEVDNNVQEFIDAFCWDKTPDKKEFMDLWTPVLKYYAEKFGKDIDAWWLDGNYNSGDKWFKRTHDWDNSRFDKKSWLEAVYAGNPDRIFAMCIGANSMLSLFCEEEYLAGESNELDKTPWNDDEADKQWHVFPWLDCFWMVDPNNYKGVIPPKYSDEELFEYAKMVRDKKGAITFNIGIYADGTMGDETIAQMKRLKEYLKNN